MPKSRLRLYCGPTEDALDPGLDLSPSPSRPSEVRVPLSEILPTLVEAARDGRLWVDDFADDEVAISSDLYEVILAYQHYRRPA